MCHFLYLLERPLQQSCTTVQTVIFSFERLPSSHHVSYYYGTYALVHISHSNLPPLSRHILFTYLQRVRDYGDVPCQLGCSRRATQSAAPTATVAVARPAGRPSIHRVSKTSQLSICSINVDKRGPIFKILSPADSRENYVCAAWTTATLCWPASSMFIFAAFSRHISRARRYGQIMPFLTTIHCF